jgi:outer membrane protein assembly factor BamB
MPVTLSRWRTAIAVTALTAGCGTHHAMDGDPGTIDLPPGSLPESSPPDTGSPPDGPPGPPPDSGPTSSPPAPACPVGGVTGNALFSIDVGRGAFDLAGDVLHSDLAVDAAGNTFLALGGAAGFSLTKYAPDGKLVFHKPFGEVVAVDAAGNAYVAATFSAALDLGLGTMLPSGDMDVFVAKLAPDGTLLFARPLGVCPDSLRSIAVACDGRIAVSGAEMGTLVLDARGALRFSLPFDGDLAFDSQGNLIVGGQFTGALDLGGGVRLTAGDVDGFVVKLDASGRAMWSYQIGDADLPVTLKPSSVMVSSATRQLVSAVAVGPDDEVVIAGQFDDDVKLFGSDFVANLVDTASVPLQSGGFVVALNATGGVELRSVRLGVDGYRDVAVAPNGDILVTGKLLGNAAPPFRFALLTRMTLSGDTRFAQSNAIGAGHAVAVDACGAPVWLMSARAGLPGDPPEAFLNKLVP